MVGSTEAGAMAVAAMASAAGFSESAQY